MLNISEMVRDTYSFNGILIRTYTRPTMIRSIAWSLCDSWASCTYLKTRSNLCCGRYCLYPVLQHSGSSICEAEVGRVWVSTWLSCCCPFLPRWSGRSRVSNVVFVGGRCHRYRDQRDIVTKNTAPFTVKKVVSHIYSCICALSWLHKVWLAATGIDTGSVGFKGHFGDSGSHSGTATRLVWHSKVNFSFDRPWKVVICWM